MIFKRLRSFFNYSWLYCDAIYAVTASLSVINAHPETAERSWYAISLHGVNYYFLALANYFRIPGVKVSIEVLLFIPSILFRLPFSKVYNGALRLGADFVH